MDAAGRVVDRAYYRVQMRGAPVGGAKLHPSLTLRNRPLARLKIFKKIDGTDWSLLYIIRTAASHSQ